MCRRYAGATKTTLTNARPYLSVTLVAKKCDSSPSRHREGQGSMQGHSRGDHGSVAGVTTACCFQLGATKRGRVSCAGRKETGLTLRTIALPRTWIGHDHYSYGVYLHELLQLE